MIAIDIVASPVDLSGGFSEPVDSDLLYISAACFWVLQQANAMSLAGMQLRQLEESDLTTAGSTLTTAMNDILDKIYTEET